MVVLQEGDVAVYERVTHLLYFMRGTELLCEKPGNGKADVGPRNLAEIRDEINARSQKQKLKAVLIKDMDNSCLFQLKTKKT